MKIDGVEIRADSLLAALELWGIFSHEVEDENKVMRRVEGTMRIEYEKWLRTAIEEKIKRETT